MLVEPPLTVMEPSASVCEPFVNRPVVLAPNGIARMETRHPPPVPRASLRSATLLVLSVWPKPVRVAAPKFTGLTVPRARSPVFKVAVPLTLVWASAETAGSDAISMTAPARLVMIFLIGPPFIDVLAWLGQLVLWPGDEAVGQAGRVRAGIRVGRDG